MAFFSSLSSDDNGASLTKFDKELLTLYAGSIAGIIVAGFWIVAILVAIEKQNGHTILVEHDNPDLELSIEASNSKEQQQDKDSPIPVTELAPTKHSSRRRRVSCGFLMIQLLSVSTLVLVTYLLLVVSTQTAPMWLAGLGAFCVLAVFLRFAIGDELRRRRFDRMAMIISLFLGIAGCLSMATYTDKTLRTGEIYEGPARIVHFDASSYTNKDNDPLTRTDVTVSFGKDWGCPKTDGKVCQSNIQGAMCQAELPERSDDSSSSNNNNSTRTRSRLLTEDGQQDLQEDLQDEEQAVSELEDELSEAQQENEALQEELDELQNDEIEDELEAEVEEEDAIIDAEEDIEEANEEYDELIDEAVDEEVQAEEEFYDAEKDATEEQLAEDEAAGDEEAVAEDEEIIDEIDEVEDELDEAEDEVDEIYEEYGDEIADEYEESLDEDLDTLDAEIEENEEELYYDDFWYSEWSYADYEFEDDYYEAEYWDYDWESVWGEYSCQDLFSDGVSTGFDGNTPPGDDGNPFINVYASCKTCDAYILDHFAKEAFEDVDDYRKQAYLYWSAAGAGSILSFILFLKYKANPQAENEVELLSSDRGVIA